MKKGLSQSGINCKEFRQMYLIYYSGFVPGVKSLSGFLLGRLAIVALPLPMDDSAVFESERGRAGIMNIVSRRAGKG